MQTPHHVIGDVISRRHHEHDQVIHPGVGIFLYWKLVVKIIKTDFQEQNQAQGC